MLVAPGISDAQERAVMQEIASQLGRAAEQRPKRHRSQPVVRCNSVGRLFSSLANAL